jgi:glucose/arabinose dehydrogenase
MLEELEQRTFFSASPFITDSDVSLTGTLPTSALVAGHRSAPIVQRVHILNPEITPLTGTVRIALELSTDPTGRSSTVPVASVVRRINLKPGRQVVIPIGFRAAPTEPTGAVFVLSVVTDSAGDSALAASAGAITIVPATINLAVTRVIAPLTARIGHPALARVTIVNSGNTLARGPLAIELLASADGSLDASSLDVGTVTRRIALAPGRQITIGLPVTLPSTGGPYYIAINVDPINTFAETTLADNQAISATSVSRGPVRVSTAGTVVVKLTRVATVPSADGTPQDIAEAPSVADRQYITTRAGDVLIYSNGALSTTPFLSFATAGVNLYTGGEGGLLDIAFSPTFSQPGTFGYGKFYTFDTEPFSTTGPAADFSSPELFPTTSNYPNNQIVIREWTVASPQATTASTTSRVLLRIDHPQSNHQGGALRFGTDGDLYIGLGDGGGGNDFAYSPGDPTDGHANATGNGQDPNVVFGKILRINPDPSVRADFVVSANGQYSIPTSNPFVQGGGLPEIYALGLRNPYRMSVDPVTGKIYVGNVGQNTVESVDIITNGGNYGWPYFEGTRNNQGDSGRTAPPFFSFTAPIAEYTHADGDAVVGGLIVRNPALPALNGQYLFGDYGGVTATLGKLFYTSANGGPITELKYDPTGLVPTSNLYGFGVDNAGNPEAFFSNGDILEITAGT